MTAEFAGKYGADRGFSFGGTGKLRDVAEQLGTAIGEDGHAQRLLCAGGAGLRAVSDLKIDFARDGSPRLRRLYWSLQRGGSGADGPFEARTWSYYYKDGGGRWYSFPEDPHLQTIRHVVEGSGQAEVLRYVPLRRLTFACTGDQRAPAIGKIKQADRYADAAARLALAGDAAGDHVPPVRMPRLLRIDHENHAFFQSRCAGENLARVATRTSAAQLAALAGEALAGLHSLPANGLQPYDSQAVLADAGNAARLVAALLPRAAKRIDVCLGRLCSSVPENDDPVFCHGDFSPGQLLADGETVAVVDFDLCHRGSRYRDLAYFLASLSAELAFLRGPASGREGTGLLPDCHDAFLEAFAERSTQRTNRAALNWHIACAELHFIMLMFRKDDYDDAMFEWRMERLEAASASATRMAVAQ